jgi:hypothetical protein
MISRNQTTVESLGSKGIHERELAMLRRDPETRGCGFGVWRCVTLLCLFDVNNFWNDLTEKIVVYIIVMLSIGDVEPSSVRLTLNGDVWATKVTYGG